MQEKKYFIYMVTRAFMDDTHTNIAFLLKFNKLLIKFHPSDAQNIAVVRKHDRGKSGLRGTTHRLMTERTAYRLIYRAGRPDDKSNSDVND